LGKEAESFQRLALLVMVLESAAPAPMDGRMIGDVGSCKMGVDVVFKGSHAEAALEELVLVGRQGATQELSDGVAQGSRLGEQGVETLDGAQGAILAGDGHHLWVQVVLELYGFEKDGRAQRKVQGGVKVGGGRDPCSRKHT
jgi:hypothetical protein